MFCEQPAQLLQRLIRFNTTNPPGNEMACIQDIQTMLAEVGIESLIVAKDACRPNLVARLPGRGATAPLLLQGHIDVVTTAHQEWTYPPFAAVEADGFIWGRGALDMKGGVAMMLAALARAKLQATELPGDVILTILSDEEVGSEYGARYLVENHAALFAGVRYALGELGGFTIHLGGQRFYPIQVLEKQCCTIQATIHGPSGHASLPLRGGAMAKAGRMLQALDTQSLPVHIVPVMDAMLQALSEALPKPMQGLLLRILDPEQTEHVLEMLGSLGTLLDALCHNTVNATIVQGGEQFNVIPGQIVVAMDGRLLPGFTLEEMLAEVRTVVGDEVELTVPYFDPGQATADMGLYKTLAEIIREDDPDGTPIPYMIPAVTDGRFFARLGIQTYGFLPMRLPQDFQFLQMIHAADERIPVEALQTGSLAIYKVLQRFGER